MRVNERNLTWPLATEICSDDVATPVYEEKIRLFIF